MSVGNSHFHTDFKLNPVSFGHSLSLKVIVLGLCDCVMTQSRIKGYVLVFPPALCQRLMPAAMTVDVQ